MSDWKQRALCTTSPMADYFTAEPTETLSREDVTEMRVAAAFLCTSCPVRRECGNAAETERLAPAVNGEAGRFPFGVHAGHFYDNTERPPEPLLYQAPPTPKPAAAPKTPRVRQPRQLAPITHGTAAGERAHQRRGETPCGDCAAARRAYDATRKYNWRVAKGA